MLESKTETIKLIDLWARNCRLQTEVGEKRRAEKRGELTTLATASDTRLIT